jgi:hypothetical protein
MRREVDDAVARLNDVVDEMRAEMRGVRRELARLRTLDERAVDAERNASACL